MSERLSGINHSIARSVKDFALPAATTLGLLAVACSPRPSETQQAIDNVTPALPPPTAEPVQKIENFRSIWIDVNGDNDPDVEILTLGSPRIIAENEPPHKITVIFGPGVTIYQCLRKNSLVSVAQPICDKAQDFVDQNRYVGQDQKRVLIGTPNKDSELIIDQPVNPDTEKPTYTVIGCTIPRLPFKPPMGDPQYGTVQCEK